MKKSVKPNKDQKGMSNLGKAVRKQQPKSAQDKIIGILPAEYSGIDPITNLSYPKSKSKKRK